MINAPKQHQDSVQLSGRHFFLSNTANSHSSQVSQYRSLGDTFQQPQHNVPGQALGNQEALSSSQPCRGLNHPGTLIFGSTTVLPEGDSDVWQQNTVEMVMCAARASSGLKSVTAFCCRTLGDQMKGPCGDLRAELEQTSESTWMNLGSLIHLQVAVT